MSLALISLAYPKIRLALDLATMVGCPFLEKAFLNENTKRSVHTQHRLFPQSRIYCIFCIFAKWAVHEKTRWNCKKLAINKFKQTGPNQSKNTLNIALISGLIVGTTIWHTGQKFYQKVLLATWTMTTWSGWLLMQLSACLNTALAIDLGATTWNGLEFFVFLATGGWKVLTYPTYLHMGTLWSQSFPTLCTIFELNNFVLNRHLSEFSYPATQRCCGKCEA